MISNNLKIVAKHLKIRFAVSEWAKELGYSKGVVSEYYNDKKQASGNFIEQLENHYNISVEEIVNGSNNKEDVLQNISRELKELKTMLHRYGESSTKALKMSLSYLDRIDENQSANSSSLNELVDFMEVLRKKSLG